MKRFHVSKNMFDKDNDYYSTEASLNVNDRRWLTYSNSASIKMICKPNTTYTISVPEELPLFRVAESNNKDILPTSQGTPITLVAALSDAKQFTFTTAADTECIIFQGSFSLRDTWHNYLMICEGSMALPYEPYGDTWQTKSPPRYETATDAVTNLPVTLYTDGQPVSSYTIKGNTTTSGTPSPSNPITIEGVGDLVTSGEHAGQYEISISSNGAALSPIYLSEPLRKSLDGTAFDTLDSTGLVTYNVDEYGQPQTVTTETVTVPTITTTGGEVSIDVDTTVKPSEMDITYHGWHEHEPLKRENGAWT